MIRQVVTIKNPTGLHLSPAGLLCKTAMQFECKITFQAEKFYWECKECSEYFGGLCEIWR